MFPLRVLRLSANRLWVSVPYVVRGVFTVSSLWFRATGPVWYVTLFSVLYPGGDPSPHPTPRRILWAGPVCTPVRRSGWTRVPFGRRDRCPARGVSVSVVGPGSTVPPSLRWTHPGGVESRSSAWFHLCVPCPPVLPSPRHWIGRGNGGPSVGLGWVMTPSPPRLHSDPTSFHLCRPRGVSARLG